MEKVPPSSMAGGSGEPRHPPLVWLGGLQLAVCPPARGRCVALTWGLKAWLAGTWPYCVRVYLCRTRGGRDGSAGLVPASRGRAVARQQHVDIFVPPWVALRGGLTGNRGLVLAAPSPARAERGARWRSCGQPRGCG